MTKPAKLLALASLLALLPAAALAKKPAAAKSAPGKHTQALDAWQNCPLPESSLAAFPRLPKSYRVPQVLEDSLRFAGRVDAGGRASCSGLVPSRFVPGKDQGGLQFGLVAKVEKPIKLWRVFTSQPTGCGGAKAEGGWWSAQDPRPRGKATYRKLNAVCESWNDFGEVIECTAQPGAVVVIGPTESVSAAGCSCKGHTAKDHYSRENAEWQVYVPLFQKGAKVPSLKPVMECKAAAHW